MASYFEKHDPQLRIRRNKYALVVEILCTIAISFVAMAIMLSGIQRQSTTYADGIKSDYNLLMQQYERTFDTVYLQVVDKIEQDVSFDEMNAWMQSMNSQWKQSMGEDVFDGLAITYKGGYARSWSYGNYDTYDATARPWWQTAQQANGETALVAPYVTFLDSQMADNESYITMSVVKKYDDTISFDYDLKLSEVRDLMEDRDMVYPGTSLILFDSQGNVLSSSDVHQYAHNINKPDSVISESMGSALLQAATVPGDIEFNFIDGTPSFVFTYLDDAGNVVALMTPFVDVFTRSFMIILIIAAFLICFEIYLYSRNRRSLIEYYNRDLRLNALSRATYEQRIYVDLETMTFYGSRRAAALVPDDRYVNLFQLLAGRITNERDRFQFADFASPSALTRREVGMSTIEQQRFAMMWPHGPENELEERTVEVGVLVSIIDERPTAGLVCRDVSEDAQILKEALDQAQQASAAKGEFMSRMSHEIRTPLNAILGYLDIAKADKDDPEKVDHCLDQASIASRHLLGIINDVLDISSIESGRMKIADDDFDLTQLVQQLTTVFYSQARTRGVDFQVTVDIDQEWVCGDELRVKQVMMNLLSNAMKFTPENGTVRMSVEQLGSHDGKVHTRFIVEDSGIGMSEEYLEHLFTPFEQEDASTARNFGGTGLGLSISNNLIHMMGGTLDVKSVKGEGTTFSFVLAFDQAQTRADEHLATQSFSNLRALVVDDDKASCEYMKKLLERCGIKSDAVTDGQKAVRRLRNRLDSDYPYDFCIVDWNMPGQGGLETSKLMKELCGEDMPVLMATAYDYTDIMDEAKEIGVNRIMSKPLFQSSLFDALVTMFGKYEPSEKQKDHVYDMNGLHVLLAEDNQMNAEIACTMLNKANIQVTTAENGKQAVDTFENSAPGTFDAILMDVQMPVMDGYEATRTIRKSAHEQAESIPIIAMTANAFTSDVTAALSAGMNDHVAKPINFDMLFETLGRLTNEEN